MSENSYNEENTIDVDFEVTSVVDVQVGNVYQGASIDDNTISTKKTWSSKKISDELALKANSADVTTALALKADTSTVNTALALKANSADVYAKSETYTKQEVDAAIPSNASGLSFDNIGTDLVATNVQSAILEVEGKIPSVPSSYDADDINYDNTTSELVATDVQAAIDELVVNINTLTNLGLNYSLVTIQSAEYTESTLPTES